MPRSPDSPPTLLPWCTSSPLTSGTACAGAARRETSVDGTVAAAAAAEHNDGDEVSLRESIDVGRACRPVVWTEEEEYFVDPYRRDGKRSRERTCRAGMFVPTEAHMDEQNPWLTYLFAMEFGNREIKLLKDYWLNGGLM